MRLLLVEDQENTRLLLERYSAILDEAADKGLGGYALIPLIKERNSPALVIGTSSLARETAAFLSPDYHLNKLEAESALEIVMNTIVRK